jgi:hypothetical protein
MEKRTKIQTLFLVTWKRTGTSHEIELHFQIKSTQYLVK